MKNYTLLFGILAALFLFTFSSCDEDSDDPEVDRLVGEYIITEATLNEGIIIEVPGIPDKTLPAGTPLTANIAAALLESTPCTVNPAGTLIELRQEGTVFYTCTGEDTEEQRGTWAVNAERTNLELRIVISDTNVTLDLSNLTESGATVSGDVVLPLPANVIDPVLPATETIPLDMNITFTKVS